MPHILLNFGWSWWELENPLAQKFIFKIFPFFNKKRGKCMGIKGERKRYEWLSSLLPLNFPKNY